MNTNHKPATSLPWETDEWGGVFPALKYDRVVLTGFSLSMGARSQEAEQNTAYVLHTANAYPELVEALRNMIEANDHGSISNIRSATDAMRALLTKLGEA